VRSARRINPLRPLRGPAWAKQAPTWADAKPAVIEAALRRAQARPSGNWFVAAASRELGRRRPLGVTIAGVEVVLWRDGSGGLRAGPGGCPHMGAPLCEGLVVEDRLYCRWHGLALDGDRRAGWSPLPAHDDGVLLWVRLDEVGGEAPLRAPVLPARPPLGDSVAAVATMHGRCEPADVVANRLDPWHGSWFHPYSFANLRVLSAPSLGCADAGGDTFVVEVAYRVVGSLGVPVVAEFGCPEPRTVVMTIVDGEGARSVVETHATPLTAAGQAPAKTAVIEASVAYSDRRGFAVARAIAPATAIARSYWPKWKSASASLYWKLSRYVLLG